MYVGKRVVPWSSLSEFRHVLSKIRSNRADDLREASQLLQIWLGRVGANQIPRAILCTYELILAKLQNSSQALAMALMRFISLVSSEQQDRARSGFAIPICTLAPRAGLPIWMSDVRNEIAHGVMPPQDLLEKALNFAMSFLVDFWETNTLDTSSDPDLTPLRDIRWNRSCGLIEEFLASPTKHVAITQTYARRMVEMFDKGLRTLSDSETKTVLGLFRAFHKVNNLIYAIYTLLPAEGSIFWANAWLQSFKALVRSENHTLLEFYSHSDLSTFPWRHCLEQVCLSSNPPNFDLTLFLELFQPQLPPKIRSDLLSICFPDASYPAI